MQLPDTRRPRVTFLAGSLEQGGAEKQMAYMVEALARAGALVEVFTLARGGFYGARLETCGVTPQWLGPARGRLVRLAALARAVGRHRPHIIQAAHTYMNVYALGVGELLRTISIGAVRTNLPFLSEFHNRLVTRLLMRTTALITNSERTRDAIITERLAPAERVHVVPNAIEPDGMAAFREERAKLAARSEVRALFLGRLIESKRVDRFLRALALARARVPGLTAVVAGEGPERANAERQARELGLSAPQVTFLGHCSDVRQVIRAADFLVFTSDDLEGSPNAILEAMAGGLPVITTPCGNAPVLVENGRNGYVCEFSEAALAAKMVSVALDPEGRRRMGAASRERVSREYGTDRLGARLFDVYRAAALSRGDRGTLRALEGACVRA